MGNMNDNNPFGTPSSPLSQSASTSRGVSVAIGSLAGGLVGFFGGVVGIVALLLFGQLGMPGIVEILIIIVIIAILFGLPGAFVGGLVGLRLNSRTPNREL